MPIHMRLPKLKGFKNPFKEEFQVVNLDRLGSLFPEGGAVGIEELVARAPSVTAVRSRCSAPATSRSPVQVSAQRVLRLGQGEDRRGRRQHHRDLSDTRTRTGPTHPSRGSSGTSLYVSTRPVPLGPLLGCRGPSSRRRDTRT